jgi:hypothetical protein
MRINIQEQCISTCWRWNDVNYNDKKHVGVLICHTCFFCLLFAFMNTFLEVHFREQPYHQVDC